jgi:hypothetical protein
VVKIAENEKQKLWQKMKSMINCHKVVAKVFNDVKFATVLWQKISF